MNQNTLAGLFLIILASACAHHAEKESLEVVDLSEAEKSVAQAQLAATPQNDLYSDGRTKLIKTANYRFEVEDVKKSTEAIIQSLQKYPAYISSSSLHLQNSILENKMTIRVQNEYFQELLQEIDLQARFVNYRNVTTDDVSKVFVDLESRLKTKREVEARYIDILKKKAGTIEELLDAERQIGALHEEIEATISRINYLKEQVSYSTIKLEFYQTITQELRASDTPTLKDRFNDALTSGWQSVVTVGIALTYIWPLLAVFIVAAIILRFKQIKREGAKVV